MARTVPGAVSPARPPGPPAALLYLGVLRRNPTAGFERIARDHPRLAHIRFGREHVYVLSHPELVHDLFVAQGRSVKKGRALEKIRILLGDGLLTSEGEVHRRQRRLIQPALHGRRIEAYTRPMVEAAEEVDARWRAGIELGDGVVDVARDMSALTLAVVGRALFGSDLRRESAEVADALGILLRGFQRHVLPGTDLLLSLPTPRNVRLFRAVERLDALVRRIIRERRAAPPGDDLLSALLQASEDGSGMDDTQIRHEVMTLLLAGHETTASALSWTWWLLSEHPEVVGWLEAELDGLDGLDDGEVSDPPPGYADLDRLPRTRAVFAEAMRLYPPSWILGRRTLTELELDGWTLPAGTLCATSQWVLHRDARFWPEPAQFQPARWLGPDGRFDESAPGQPRGAYLPFGMGSRLCVGRAFAWAEGVLVLATLARRWRLHVVRGHPVVPMPAVTLRPKHGIRMVLEPRA